jgi:glycosyltransferase involved in cell wall biosynthesis
VQAQAVGTPVIGLNAGATKDVLGAGVLVEPFFDYFTPNMMRRADPHPGQVADALQKVYETPRSDFRNGVRFVQDNFSMQAVIPKWKRLLEDVDAELERRCIKQVRYPPTPSPRAAELGRRIVEVA